jgi:hypothetical protein
MANKYLKIGTAILFIQLVLATVLMSFGASYIYAQTDVDIKINLEKAKVSTLFILFAPSADVSWQAFGQIGLPTTIRLEPEVVGSGTGFLVSPDGYIVTNGHVVGVFNDDFEKHQPILFRVINIIIQVFQQQGWQLSQQDIQQIESAVVNAYKQGELKISSYQPYIAVGLGQVNNPLGSLPSFVPARIVDAKPAEVEDLAILKIEKQNLPSLIVASEDYLRTGDQIWAIGYPGVVVQHGMLNRQQVLYTPSVTSGTFSNYRQKETGPKVFEATAPVTHGNSGGPAIDNTGKVVGVATFVSIKGQFGQQIQGFNFFMAASLVREILARNNIQNYQGSLMKVFEDALKLYYNKHYSAALEEFQKMRNLYPEFPYINDYISSCQAAILRGEDVPLTNWTLIFTIIGVVAAAAAIGFYIFFIRTGKIGGRKVKVKPQYQPVYQPQYQPQYQQPTYQPQQPPSTQQPPPQPTKFCIFCGARIPVSATVCPVCNKSQVPIR